MKPHELRYDRYGEFRLLARAEGYVMARRKGRAPCLMTEREWNAMALTSGEVRPLEPRIVGQSADIIIVDDLEPVRPRPKLVVSNRDA